MQECLFDFEQMQRDQVAATPWHGAPLAYTTDYYTPAEITAAWERYIAEHGHFGSYPRSHMWHPTRWHPGLDLDNGHQLHQVTADTRCTEGDHDHTHAPLPGKLMYQAICEPCRWHHIGGESEIVLAWHDHAMPGWRDLPIVPAQTKNIAAWIETAYSPQWQFKGAPIITHRDPMASRSVPGRSPLGGYDIAATAL